MGLYVNPPHEAKEKFLEREAKEISRAEFIEGASIASEKAYLCLVENPAFSACVVAENKRDAVRYSEISDKRTKRYFSIERPKLEGCIDEG